MYFMTCTSWPITWCVSPLVASHFYVYVLPNICLFHYDACTMHVMFLLLYWIPCVADPSRSSNSALSLCFHLSCHNSELSVSCFLLTHVYHLTSNVLSLDHLACHYLAKPYCYNMTDPDYIDLLLCLVVCNITTSHAITSHPAWHTWLYDYYVYGNPVLLLLLLWN